MAMEANASPYIEEVANDGYGSKYDEDGHPKRKGSGVLSLAWAIAQLGWIAGPVVLMLFSLITLYTSFLLTDCYRSPDPVHGTRNRTYRTMVKNILGGAQYHYCGLAQYINLIGAGIGYTITASISMVAIKRSNCYHKNGHEAVCHVTNYPYMLIFAIIEIILSQIPDLHELSWLSAVAAVMSFGYASIGIGLSIAKVAGKSHARTSITGVTIGVDVTSSQKLWNTFTALGNIAFAYNFSSVIVEIQDTLKSSKSENREMKVAATTSVAVTTFFYMLCGIVGYAAFGNDAPGNFLTGFGFYEPFWLVDIGNIFIAVHLVGAYQVFSQPVFSLVENWGKEHWPQSSFMAKEHHIKIPLVGTLRMNFFRLIWRTVYVIFSAVIAVILPFFNSIVGLLGALVFWPLTVHFPTQMYLVQAKVPKFSMIWLLLKLLSGFCLLVSFVAAAGSIEGIVKELKVYQPFKS
ncbi:Amino acid permease 6 [Stylosanthes scabra]|uniref:Amino acid permease 6 n=1 Tax=Stylosanthes scabra TaxID=79078 RepID=A0ABU6TJF0_9FABA|nr:Amino acid permease 6 [Stylosanthes scabra]